MKFDVNLEKWSRYYCKLIDNVMQLYHPSRVFNIYEYCFPCLAAEILLKNEKDLQFIVIKLNIFLIYD